MTTFINITLSTNVVLVPTVENKPFTVYLRNTNTPTYRLITVRDGDGYASQGNPIRISTLPGAYFDGTSIQNSITTPFGFITYQTASNGSYTPITSFQSYISHPLANVSNLFTPTVRFNDSNIPNQTNTMFISSQNLYVNSTIRGQVTESNLTSTIQSLGSLGYISSLSTPTERLLQSTVRSLQTSFSTGSFTTNTLTTGTISPFSVYNLNKLYVTVGVSTLANEPCIQTSSDGIVWSTINTITFPNGGYGVTWNPSGWVAVGQNAASSNNTIFYSKNGLNWSNITTSGLQFSQNVVTDGIKFIVLGTTSFTPSDCIRVSFDGMRWVSNIPNQFIIARSATWNGSYWLATGIGSIYNNSLNSIQRSYDGFSWTNSVNSGGFGWADFSYGGYDIAWNGLYWVSVGYTFPVNQQLTIQYSYDGYTWLPINTGGFSIGRGVAYNGLYWVASGTPLNPAIPTQSIQYSYDGSNWTNINTGGFNQYGSRVTWDGNKWIAVGYDTSASGKCIQYSYDGSNWFQSSGNSFVACFGIAVGYTNSQPSLQASTLALYTNYQPFISTQTHAIYTIQDTVKMDATLFINSSTNTVGINTIYPSQSSLSIQGNVSFYSTLSLSSIQLIQHISSIPFSAIPALYKPFFYNPTNSTIGYT